MLLGNTQALGGQLVTSVSLVGGLLPIKEALATTAQMASGRGSVRRVQTVKTHHRVTMFIPVGSHLSNTISTVAAVTTAKPPVPSREDLTVIQMVPTGICSI